MRILQRSWLFLAAGLLSSVPVVGGEVRAERFPDAFQAAVALRQTPAEAEAVFVALAERQEEGPFQRIRQDAAYFEAADCAIRQRAYDRANAHAQKITAGPQRTLVLMKLLAHQRHHTAVLELARTEPIESWPDALVFDAANIRGNAAVAERDFKLAEMDLRLATRFTIQANAKADVFLRLGNLYRNHLADPEQAMAAYNRVLDVSHRNWRYYQATIGFARLAVARGQGEAALERLGRLGVDAESPPMTPQFIVMAMHCYGDVHAAMGNAAEALRWYRKTLALPSVPRDIATAVQRSIEQLAPEGEVK